MSVDSTDEASRTRRDMPASEFEPLGDVCAGCRELAERVASLERQLLEQRADVAATSLGTTKCYWICIAVHAFVTFCLFSNEIGVQFGLLALAGAAGTVSVCHVLSTRPRHVKIMRSILSTSIVAGTAIIAMWLAGVGDPSDFMPFIWVYLPFLFASAWLVAKIFVWSRGWRIVPPEGASEFPKLRIWHLLLCTFIVAVHLSVGRVLVDDTADLFGGEMVILVLYVTLPTAICTMFSCALARIILLPSNSKVLKHVAILGGATLLVSGSIFTSIVIASAGLSSAAEAALLFVPVSFLITLGVFASPCFTFLMLRIAKYRFVVPGRSA